MSLLLAGRMTVLAEVMAFDLSQLRPTLPEVAASVPRLRELPPLLRLSQLQMQDIAAGACWFGVALLPFVLSKCHVLCCITKPSARLTW